MSGISFGLGKRAAAPKKVSVNDLFAADSDDDGDDAPAAGAKKQRQQGPTPPAVANPTATTLSSTLDLETRAVAEKLADFVAKNGRQFEDMTRDRNPGNTPFRFLHDKQCAGYKYYEAKIREVQGALTAGPSAVQPSAPTAAPAPLSRATMPTVPAAPIPAASRWGSGGAFSERVSVPAPVIGTSGRTTAQVEEERRVAAEALAKGNSVAAMEAFMALAARKERQARGEPADSVGAAGSGEEGDDPASSSRGKVPLLNATGFDRRKVTAVFKEDGSRGHHMQDFIPPEELARLLAKGGDAAAAQHAKALENKHAIGSDNIGHKLLSKMGWKEGSGVGAAGNGITAPIQAVGTKQESLGLGAAQHGEVSADDDPYEQYRKRMQLGYKHRPNPLGNPRKSYY